MLKKKGAPSFKPKAGIRRNPPPTASRLSKTPAPTTSAGPGESAGTEAPAASAPAVDTPPATEPAAQAAPTSVPSEPLPTPAATAPEPSDAPSSQPAATRAAVPRPVPAAATPAVSRAPVPGESRKTPQRTPTPVTARVAVNVQAPQPDKDAGRTTPRPQPITATRPDSAPVNISPPTDRTTEAPVEPSQPSAPQPSVNTEQTTSARREQAHLSEPLTPTPTATSSASDNVPIDPEIAGAMPPNQPAVNQGKSAQIRKRKAPGSTEGTGAAGSSTNGEELPAATPARKRRAAKSQIAQATTTDGTEPTTGDGEQGAGSASGVRKRPAARRKVRAVAPAQEGVEDTADAEADRDAAAPRPRARTKKTANNTTAGAAGDANGEGAQTKPTRRRKKAATSAADTEAEGSTGEVNEAGVVKKKRAPRRERSETPEDAEERVIDPNSLTMAELTKDLRIGKKFSRHDELRDRMKELSAKQREERRLRKLGGEGTGSGEDSSTPAADGLATQGAGAGGGAATPAARAPAVVGPQFEIINGEIVINQASLVHDRHAEAMADQVDMEEVEENDFTRMTNSSTYLRPNKLRGPNAWNREETAQFYDYLRMFGTDFQTIANMFPGRTRRHVKMKFNREERHNPTGVNAALVGLKEVMIDLDEYQTRTGRELEATAAIEEEHQRRQEEHDAEQRRIQEEADALQAEKRKKLLGTGPGGDGVDKGEVGGASKSKPSSGAAAEPEEDVEIIDEDAEEARPPPPKRKRRGGGIGG